jgi:hypothetical protein
MVAIAAVLSLSLSVAARADAPKHPILRGYPNLQKAMVDLREASSYITKSQQANECVFKLEGGHGQKAKEAIEAAEHQVQEAADWVATHDKDCHGVEHKPIDVKVPPRDPSPTLKNHVNLAGAYENLVWAYYAMFESQHMNECVYGLEGGHGEQAREAIAVAMKQVKEAAAWVESHENECKK